jgi:cystathionine gamma-lyase
MQTTSENGFGTRAIHAGQAPDPSTGAVMPPIYQTSTFAQHDPYTPQPYSYGRVSNPTRTALEQNLASLENAQFGTCFASGQAASDAIMKCLASGDHVVATQDIYGGTYRLFKQVYEKFGLSFSFVDTQNHEAVEQAFQPNTKLLWLETPSNPLLRLTDIKTLSQTAAERQVAVVVDNTFASPYLQRPLDLGATMVMHSTTKYLGGHSDVLGGAVCTNDETWHQALQFQAKATGGIPSPMDCFLLLRGTKTLHLRMDRHCENALKLAQFLQAHPKVSHVFYPGLPDHPDHALALKQMKDFGGMVSFQLNDDRVDKAIQVMRDLQFFVLAESLGGVESLVAHPATMSHGGMPAEERKRIGISDSLIRLSVGVEDIEDLLKDVSQALDRI